VQNSQSKAVAGGNVFLYQPGTTTFITSYFDSGLVQPHANPVRLSGSGRANIWITQDCDLRVEDKNGNLILEELNANPDAVGVDQGGGLVPNGSFETDADADLIPDGWTLVSEIGATNALDTSQSTDGAQSFRFTSSGNGGGSLTTIDFFPVNDTDNLSVAVDMFASIATVLNIVRVEWYDISFVSISNSDIYSSTANPLTWTTQNLLATPPANARFAKLRLIGGDPSVAIAGSSWWDNVSVFYPAVVSGVFDNVTIQDNQIITTNVNGDLELGPNGTGAVNINQANPVTLADAKNALNLGTDDPALNPHLALGLGAAGVTILQAKATGTTAVDRLDINPLGGDLRLGQQTGSDSEVVEIYRNTNLIASFTSNTINLNSDTDGDPTVPDALTALIELNDLNDSANYAQLGFNASTTLELHSQVEGGLIHVIGEQAGSGQVVMGDFDPDGEVNLYHQGAIKFSTAANGIFSRGSVVTADPGTTEAVDSRLVLQGLNATYNLAVIGYEGNNNLAFRNRMESGHVRLAASATGGTVRNLLIGDPDADVGLYQVGVEVARTLTAAAGGFQVNNTLTGAGFERVLTTSDLVGVPSVFTFVKQANTDRVNNTVTADPDLNGNIEGFTHYSFEAFLAFDNPSATPDVRFGTNGSAGSGVFKAHGVTDATPTGQNGAWEHPGTLTNFTLAASTNLPTGIAITGYINYGTTVLRNIYIAWAQNTTDGANRTRLREGSWMLIQGLV
jgi:hypothetical protein